MSYVYVRGIGGLGNILFQVASAIYYCENFGYTLCLEPNTVIAFGTSNNYGRTKSLQNGSQPISYTQTIFSKLLLAHMGISHQIVNNHSETTRIVPDGSNIEIAGFCQNPALIMDMLTHLPKYLELTDTNIKEYIMAKYGDLTGAICIGVRVGNDFKHMGKITKDSYRKAIKHLHSIGNQGPCYIIGDVSDYDLEKCIDVKESDIVQLYFGMACSHYILSESTFHLWIAYLGTLEKEKTVICFNDTDITNRRLNKPGWITLDY